jgi:hypothetical protein
MSTFSVSVTVGSSGITVEPSTQIMTTDDDVQWTSGNGRRFTIEFEGAGPFATPKLDHAAATSRQRPRSLGRFKYTVISEDNPGMRLDPVIVIDPPPTEH